MRDFIMIFNNTHEAMEGEKVFKSNNIKFIIMPTPTYITKSCGISIRYSGEEENKVELLYNDLKFKNIYVKDNKGFRVYK